MAEVYTPIGSSIEVFNINGTKKGYYQGGSGDYLGCKFSIHERGCVSAVLSFAKYVDIDRRDTIKIKIFNSNQVYFTGVVRDIPIEGATEQKYEYKSFGYSDYLNRLNTRSLTYNNKSVRYIVLDLLDDIITDLSPITKNLSKIDTLSTNVTSIEFHYITITEALEQLQKIANVDGNDYLFGVDVDGDFFFRARNTNTIANLVVGKIGDYGIEQYSPKEEVKPISRLLVLRADGTFYGIYTSTEDIDINELKLTGPQISDTDLDLWAQGQLSVLEVITRQATIQWQIKTRDPFLIIADGYLRILSSTNPSETNFINVYYYGQNAYGSGPYGGDLYTGYELDDTLRIKEIEYTINDKRAYMKIQLGSLPVQLDLQVIALDKKIEDLKTSLKM
jgi:hypothetical protein